MRKFSNHPHLQVLTQGLQRSRNAVNAGRVFDVGQPVHFLWAGVQAACQLCGAHVLRHHLIEQQHFGRQTGRKFNNMLAAPGL